MGAYSIASGIPDEDLVRRYCRGEEDAFSQLYHRYRPRVMSTTYRILRNRQEAQDATQEVFLKIHLSLSDWNSDKSALSTWLYRLAANHAIDCWRAQRRRRAEIDKKPDVAQCAAVESRTPDIALEIKEYTGELQRHVDRLPELQRRFFILHYFHGLKLEEIARLENRSLGTVKGLLYRATHSVRRHFPRPSVQDRQNRI
jgi:RNA polymerase sigma-70 factor (ECF subfamily)